MIINGRFLSQPVTGVQRYALEMTRELRRLKADIQVVCPRNVLHREVADELSAVVIGRSTGYYWEQVDLPRYLRTLHPRPVLMNLANLAPLFHDRNLVVIHDTAPLRHPEWYSRRFSLVYRLFLPSIARRALHVLTDSRFSAAEITELLSVESQRLTVVPAAVGAFFQDPSELQDKPSASSYILTVGSLDPRKNLSALIKAYVSLGLADMSLVVVGAENRVFASPGLNDSARESFNVKFLADVTDTELRVLYRNATLFVFPSLYEGFGLPPLEAMACGCPCLVANSGSLPEVCGDAVAYCDPHDTEDIARSIQTLLENDQVRTVYRERGFRQARSYSWRDSASVLLDVALKLSTK